MFEHLHETHGDNSMSSAHGNMRMTAGFGVLTPDMLASLTQNLPLTPGFSANSTAQHAAKNPQQKRITFNPGDFDKLHSSMVSNQLDDSSHHKSKQTELSLEFNFLTQKAQPPVRTDHTNSFLSPIYRDKEASYLGNPNVSLNLTNASLAQTHADKKVVTSNIRASPD